MKEIEDFVHELNSVSYVIWVVEWWMDEQNNKQFNVTTLDKVIIASHDLYKRNIRPQNNILGFAASMEKAHELKEEYVKLHEKNPIPFGRNEVLKRKTSKSELDEIIDYWLERPRASSYLIEDSLIKYLEYFTPDQIKGAMYIATSKGREAYFNYMCGILHNWKKALENGEEPGFFDIN